MLFGFVLKQETAAGAARAVKDPALSLDRETKMSRLISIYSAEVGIREQSGRNDGKRVEEYLAYAGLSKGNPWCAAFVCWALGKAGIENPRSGYSPALFPKSKVVWRRSGGKSAIKCLTTASCLTLPQPGDVFGIYFPEKGRIAHAGFVDSWKGNFLITVEGNTNLAGSREGDGVYRKRRLIGAVDRVARWE